MNTDAIAICAIITITVAALIWANLHDRKVWREYEKETIRILPLTKDQTKRIGKPEARGYLFPEKNWGLWISIQTPDMLKGKPVWTNLRVARVGSLAPTFPPTYEDYLYKKINEMIEEYVKDQKRKASRDEFFAKYEGN